VIGPTVLSESARASSASEQRFRIQAPNSLPRATTVIALDAASEPVLERLAAGAWTAATFLKAPLSEEAIRRHVDRSDQVIMLAAAGGGAEAAAAVGRACSRTRVMTTGLIVGAERAADRDVSKTLAQLRPWSLMVVIAGSDDYIADMMAALRV
jgi:hypothetical protein